MLLLFGVKPELFYPESKDILTNVNCHSRKIKNIIKEFWDQRRRECLNNLHEHQKIKCENNNRASDSVKDIVLEEEDKKLRSI